MCFGWCPETDAVSENFHAVTYGPGLQATFTFKVGDNYEKLYDLGWQIWTVSDASDHMRRFPNQLKARNNSCLGDCELVLFVVGLFLLAGAIVAVIVVCTRPADVVSSTTGRVYHFFSQRDSDHGDLEQRPELARNLSLLMKHCDHLSGCIAFNTNGWFKYALLPMSNWTSISSNAQREEGLYWVQGFVLFRIFSLCDSGSDCVCFSAAITDARVFSLVTKTVMVPLCTVRNLSCWNSVRRATTAVCALDAPSLVTLHRLVASHTGMTIFEAEGVNESDVEAGRKFYATAVGLAQDLAPQWHPVYGVANTALVTRCSLLVLFFHFTS